ncbi:hypothetical protein [Herpetosiphon giganteus]|uniref:hypothetical protein n=1 Tax=Herpetosiphon giganteus TaxID=2029754 RepID=UPI00195C3ADA|nr:hypothetical protein [Herpetosiphon giganteus]MBM7844638.1 hypothetical protein [Herpetosiphon giganteus]
MCTSFAINQAQDLVAMNFDIGPRPIALSMPNPAQLLILQSEQGQWLPAIGLTNNGRFMNLQMLPATAAGAYRRNNNVMHMMKVFKQFLAGAIDFAALQNQQIVNVPNHSVHSLLRDEHGQLGILEPGQIGLVQHEQSLIQTNFSLHSTPVASLSQQPSADRYLSCQQLLNQQQPDVDQAFAILAATQQTAGDFPTQLSLVFEPQQHTVWFAQPNQFSQRWRFTFGDQQLIVGKQSYQLSKKRLSLSSLSN